MVRNFAQLKALRWLCDKNEMALQAQSQLYPEISVTQDFDEILKNPEIQAVVLATPAAMHYAQVKQAILSGKDVFVKKPLALRYKEG
ncbi:Gfo/Idh/MocA family protein [Oscillatoria acuminata]|uniref:Gfo/Idh/MocA family protein n=1 Tax=Oscillatoria acuminata TaxID=118323 RepID=UPI0018DB735C|nr:Gfo/Idh/MocA family oxidoreductase [Oscillatoria acuminata]